MFLPFEQLPPSARIWIYQANRPLTAAEQTEVQPTLHRFADEWTSHGRTLAASAVVLHDQFLVIGLDEGVADASGCSIDASVRFVQGVEQQLGLELLEKSKLAFWVDGHVTLPDRQQLGPALASRPVRPGPPHCPRSPCSSSTSS